MFLMFNMGVQFSSALAYSIIPAYDKMCVCVCMCLCVCACVCVCVKVYVGVYDRETE